MLKSIYKQLNFGESKKNFSFLQKFLIFSIIVSSIVVIVETENDIYLKKAPYAVRTIQLDGSDFFSTLREKLFWGQDKRNTQ